MVVQDYSFRPAWTWTPTVGDLGDYSLQVWVRARGSTQPLDDWRASAPFTIAVAPAQVLALQANVLLPAPAGTIITWTASASGGSLPLEYQFVRYAPGLGRWLTVRTWDASPVWEQRTTSLDEGVNTVIVVVRSRGSAEMEASETTTFELGPPPATYVLSSREDVTGLLHAQQIFYPDSVGSVGVTVTDGLHGEGHQTCCRPVPPQWILADGEGRAPAPGLYDEVQVNPDPDPRHGHVIPGDERYGLVRQVAETVSHPRHVVRCSGAARSRRLVAAVPRRPRDGLRSRPDQTRECRSSTCCR